MATSLKRLSLRARNCTCQFTPPVRRHANVSSQWPVPSRPFSSSIRRLAEEEEEEEEGGEDFTAYSDSLENIRPSGRTINQMKTAWRNLGLDPKAELNQEELLDKLGQSAKFHRMFDVIDRRPPREPYLPPPVRDNRGFWQDGEKEAVAPDEEFKGDDMSSLAHGELELHRERREYMRLAAWEMPLLSKLAKPFNPPQKTHPLRFRYTTYMGEQHPAEPKVVVEFCPSDLPSLSPQQTRKFIKLCGPRYNPGTEIVKMSCESFTTAAENKRYLSDMVDALIAEAQDPKDTFEDVPFDFRHHKEKKKPEFPKEWLLTETRKKILEAKRAGQELEDQRKVDDGKLIDGGVLVEEALKRLPVNAPVMEEVISRGRGKAGRKR